MGKVMVTLTEESFIGGVLKPIGAVVEVDEADLGAKVGEKSKPAQASTPDAVSLTPNMKRVGRDAGDDQIEYEVAAISPTGPAPTAPQAVPPGTTQPTAGTFVAPAEPEADSAGVKVVPQDAPAKPAAKRN